MLGSKVALVTGAANGLGAAITRKLLQGGASVGMLDVATDGAAVSTSFNAEFGRNRTCFLRVDVTNDAELEGAFKSVASQLGPIDIVFNNAGIGGDYMSDIDRVVAVNLTAVVKGTKLAMAAMKGRGGVIVNTASQAGLFTMPYAPVYAATKAAVVHFSRSLAALADTDGIRVHALCPGFADTPLVRNAPPGLKPFLGPRLLTAEEVADAAMALVEDDTIAGKALVVDQKFGVWAPEYDPRKLLPPKPKSKL